MTFGKVDHCLRKLIGLAANDGWLKKRWRSGLLKHLPGDHYLFVLNRVNFALQCQEWDNALSLLTKNNIDNNAVDQNTSTVSTSAVKKRRRETTETLLDNAVAEKKRNRPESNNNDDNN